METILMSIHPKWCEKIFNGEKTIEVRKTAPKPPFKVVVYCTKGIQYLALITGGGTAQLFACCNWKNSFPCGGEIGNGFGSAYNGGVGARPLCNLDSDISVSDYIIF